LADVLVGEGLVDQEPDQVGGDDPKARDDEDGDQDPDETAEIGAPVGPDATQQVPIDVGAIVLLVVLQIAPPATGMEDAPPPGFGGWRLSRERL